MTTTRLVREGSLGSTDEVHAAAPSPPHQRLIFLMNGWDSAAGGIQTVNRELATAVAKARPEQLGCVAVVKTASQAERLDAASRGITLLAGTRPESEWDDVLLSPELEQLDRAGVIAVIGHSYFSGRQAARLRDRHFPSALSLQFVHMSPLDVEGLKEYKQDSYIEEREAKLAEELDIAERADLVVCIGPRLHRAMHGFLTPRGKAANTIKQINCGMSRLSDSPREPLLTPTLLCLGRTQSIPVKGLDIFAYAAGHLSNMWAEHPSTCELPAPQFRVRGAQDDGTQLEAKLLAYAAEVGARPPIIARPYTHEREVLASDYRGATGFMMPSREEGFGLVACEALSYGVPTIVSENSGVAEVIRSVAGVHHMDVSRCVISMNGDPKQIGERFAKAALWAIVNKSWAASFYNELSERMLQSCSWEIGADQLLKAIDHAVAARNSTIEISERPPQSTAPDDPRAKQYIPGTNRESQPARIGLMATDPRGLVQLLDSTVGLKHLGRRGRRYMIGKLDHGGPEIVISDVPERGNISAASTTMALLLDNDIAAFIVVGLCGGLDPRRQQVGDVIVASDVIHIEYERRRGKRFRISGSASPRVLGVAREIAREAIVTADRPFNVHIGATVSTDTIFDNQEELAEIVSNWQDILAVEMEGAGVFHGVRATGQDISIGIVYGISDLVDANKRDTQERESQLANATGNAVAVAIELSRRLSTDPGPSDGPQDQAGE
jgi:nucleoside phosphorylase/glycosyltransferase involved in cell wall biosynthesis